MERVSLTRYDDIPEDMIKYLRNYGPHFNRKLCEFSANNMYVNINGVQQRIKPYNKENIDNMLSMYGVTLKNGQLYDCVYVANMCKADFLNSSIIDERHLALYIKDVIDDVDAPDGLIFNRFYADCCYKGIAIDWEEMI